MGIWQQWQAAGQVMAQEKDERSELANLRVARDVLIALVATVVVIAIGFLMVPVSDQDRVLGLPVLLIGVVLVGGVTYRVSRKRNRPYSREYERAESFKALVFWIPLSVLTGTAAIVLMAYRMGETPWSLAVGPVAVGLALGIGAGVVLEYARYRRLAS
jgi:small-conductance mechanosensitive channel